MAMGQNPVPPSEHPIHPTTKIGSTMGEFTNPNQHGINHNGFDNYSHIRSKTFGQEGQGPGERQSKSGFYGSQPSDRTPP